MAHRIYGINNVHCFCWCKKGHRKDGKNLNANAWIATYIYGYLWSY